MKESFKNILKASALSSSNFVQSMYLNEKDDLDEELKGVKFETTITILDENDTPVMVARATSCLEDSKPAEKEEAAAEETVGKTDRSAAEYHYRFFHCSFHRK